MHGATFITVIAPRRRLARLHSAGRRAGRARDICARLSDAPSRPSARSHESNQRRSDEREGGTKAIS